jgi:hypothetical protein
MVPPSPRRDNDHDLNDGPRKSSKVTTMAYMGKQSLANLAPNHPFAKPQIGFVPRASANSSVGAVSTIVSSSSKMLEVMSDAVDYLQSLKASAEQDGMKDWAAQLSKAIALAPQASSVEQFQKMLAVRGI